MRPILIVSLFLCAAGCSRPSSETANNEAAPAPPPSASAPAATETPAPPPEAQTPVGATAELKATQGNGVSGTLMFAPAGDGVHITGSIKGLAPNSTHGFHVHEKGDCSAPDASSAGAHYNPTQQPHGDPAGASHHLGDMPNVTADGEGSAELDATVTGLTLRTAQADDIVGKSIVVHEKADDYKSQPSGDSGNRIACGIIK
jgi:superoxide dismutase, Cu-Zn family